MKQVTIVCDGSSLGNGRGTTRCGGCETNERSREALQAWAEGLSAWSSRGLHIACEALHDDD